MTVEGCLNSVERNNSSYSRPISSKEKMELTLPLQEVFTSARDICGRIGKYLHIPPPISSPPEVLLPADNTSIALQTNNFDEKTYRTIELLQLRRKSPSSSFSVKRSMGVDGNHNLLSLSKRGMLCILTLIHLQKSLIRHLALPPNGGI